MAFYVFDGTRFYVTAAAGPSCHLERRLASRRRRLRRALAAAVVDGHPVGDPIAAPGAHRLCLDVVRPLLRDLPGHVRAAAARRRRPRSGCGAGRWRPDFIGTLADAAVTASPTVPPAVAPSPESVPVATRGRQRRPTRRPAGRRSRAIAPGTSFAAPSRPAVGAAPKAIAGAPARALRRALGERARARRPPRRS